MCSCHSIPECFVMFSGVKLSMGLFVLFRKQSLKMLQTGVEEFKIFLWKISLPNIKF